MIETRIEAALLSHVAALEWPSDQIAWPNLTFEPTLGTAWIRPTNLPAETRQVSMGEDGRNRFTGVFQVSLFYPAGEGMTKPLDEASKIIAHFKRGTVIERDGAHVRIDRPPWRETAQQEADWYHIPIRIRYLADATNPT